MNTQEVVMLHAALTRLKETSDPSKPPPVKFAYASAINVKRTLSVFEAYRSAADPMTVPSFADYETQRKTLVETVARRHDSGEFIVVNNEYVVDDRVAFNAKVAELKATFPTLDADIKAHEEKVLALNDEPVEVSIHMVSLDFCPPMSLDIMDGIQYMIKEE